MNFGKCVHLYRVAQDRILSWPQKVLFCPFQAVSLLLLLHIQEYPRTIIILSPSLVLPILALLSGITQHVFVCLASFTQHSVFEIHLCSCMLCCSYLLLCSIPLCGFTTMCPFSSGWMFALFPVLSYCE